MARRLLSQEDRPRSLCLEGSTSSLSLLKNELMPDEFIRTFPKSSLLYSRLSVQFVCQLRLAVTLGILAKGHYTMVVTLGEQNLITATSDVGGCRFRALLN